MSVTPAASSNTSASEIVGVWKFLGCEILNFDTNEHIAYYMNKAPHGYLCYTDDGYMSFALSGISDNGEDSNNPTDKKHLEQLYFAHADWRKATNEEKAKAFDSFLGYSGKYTYDTEKQIVTHYIEASLCPNWIGEKQERVIRFADKEKNMLLLNTPPAKFPDRPISFYSSIKFSRAVGAVFGSGMNGANAAIRKAQEGERPPCQCIIQ